MAMKINVPKLRFPEFEGEWEEKKGRELFNNKRKKGEPHLPIYSVTQDQGLVPRDSLQRHMGNNASDEANLQANPGDVVYNMMRMWQGAVGICHQDCMVSPAYVILEPRNVNSEFFIQLFKNGRYLYFLNVFSQGITSDRLRLYYRDFIQIKFNLPTLPEQQKIATFLTTIDTRIQQLSRKKALLEQYKKGVMQQIFSQEIRFKDEDGKEFPAWEERKAKTIFRNHTNKDHIGDLPILAITQDKGVVPRDSIDKEIQSSESSVLSYKIVMPGDFVISLRSFQGGIEYSEIKGICSPAYTVLKASTEICDAFFKQYLKKESFIRQLNNTVVGIREGKQISFDAFSGLILPFPCIPEQQKIAAFLSTLDRQINLVSQQLERIQTFKKGLLQQMFV